MSSENIKKRYEDGLKRLDKLDNQLIFIGSQIREIGENQKKAMAESGEFNEKLGPKIRSLKNEAEDIEQEITDFKDFLRALARQYNEAFLIERGQKDQGIRNATNKDAENLESLFISKMIPLSEGMAENVVNLCWQNGDLDYSLLGDCLKPLTEPTRRFLQEAIDRRVNAIFAGTLPRPPSREPPALPPIREENALESKFDRQSQLADARNRLAVLINGVEAIRARWAVEKDIDKRARIEIEISDAESRVDAQRQTVLSLEKQVDAFSRS